MIENKPDAANAETVHNIEKRIRDNLDAAVSLSNNQSNQLANNFSENSVTSSASIMNLPPQNDAAQVVSVSSIHFPDTPAILHSQIVSPSGDMVPEGQSRLKVRLNKIFSKDLSLREKIRATPLLGYALAWVNALVKLPVTRHHHQVDIEFLQRKLALSEEKNVQVNARLSAAQAYIDAHANQLKQRNDSLEVRIKAQEQVDASTRLQSLEQIRAATRLHLIEMLDVGTRLMKLEQIEGARKLKHFVQLIQLSQSESNRLKDQLTKLDLQMEKIVGAMQTGASPDLNSPASRNFDFVQDRPANKLNTDQFFADFEDAFRGKKEEIKRRLEVYLPHVLTLVGNASSNSGFSVVDVGCGRGEWLELMAEKGISALGIDLNEHKVKACIDAGLAAKTADAISFLREQKAGSLAVVTGFHIIEHLPFETLIALFDAALAALKPGGIIIFETPNPENLLVGACNFYFDPTHLNPIVPAVAQFMATQRGFSHAEIVRLHPYPDDHLAHGTTEVDHIVNRYLFGAQDYALVARK